MSWMTPLSTCGAGRPAACASADTADSNRLAGQRRVSPAQLLDPVPAALHAAERQPEVRDSITDRVIGLIARQLDQQAALVRDRAQPAPGQLSGQLLGALVHLDQ